MSTDAESIHQGPDHDYTIGLFGPRPAVRQMVQAGQGLATTGVRFLSEYHQSQSEAEDQFRKVAGKLDAAVFPGPWHHDQARQAGYLTVPATHVPLTGAALYATLLRCALEGIDVRRLSIDSLTEQDVHEAYEELGLPTGQVKVMAYDLDSSPAEFIDFHRAHLRTGDTAVALTTFFDVEKQLKSEGLSVMRIRPTRSSVRRTISTALLLARGSKLHEQQIALIAVRLPEAGDGAPGGPSNYWQQEVTLSVHRFLLNEVRHSGGTVLQRSESLFMITTTRGGLNEITSDLAAAPFLANCRERLGLQLWVGVGLGVTARDAEINALAGAEMASSSAAAGHAALVDSAGRRLLLGEGRSSEPVEPLREPRAATVLQQLLDRLRGQAGRDAVADLAELTVGVEEVAALLDVTPRTGRRICKSLVEAGLAWPIPPVRSPNGGRPRQQFRLLPDKLTTNRETA